MHRPAIACARRTDWILRNSDHAHQRAGRACQPPDRLLIVDRKCDADIGEQADAAHEIENEEAAQDPEPFQAQVAIGQEIVEQEIAGHRQDRAKACECESRPSQHFERDKQASEMDDDTDRSCQREQQKPQLVAASCVSFASTRPRKSSATIQIQLALAVQPRAEGIGISLTRNAPRAVAISSSRILNPLG